MHFEQGIPKYAFRTKTIKFQHYRMISYRGERLLIEFRYKLTKLLVVSNN